MSVMWNLRPAPTWPPSADPELPETSAAIQCIDDATQHLRTGQARARLLDAISPARVVRRLPYALSWLTLCALLIFGTWTLANSRRDRAACEAAYYACEDEQLRKAMSGAILDQSALTECSSLSEILPLLDGPDQACDMETSRALLGMAAWRWMLFLGVFWPTQVAAQVLVAAVSVLVAAYTRAHGRISSLYTHGLRAPAADAVRAGVWLGIWFALAQVPLEWCDRAAEWNTAAGQEVWPTVFDDAHFVIWRLLLLWFLISLARFLAKCACRYFAVQFHYIDHTSDGSRELESALRRMLEPRHVPATETVKMSRGAPVTLRGNMCLWWAALRFLARVSEHVNPPTAAYAVRVRDRLCTYFARAHGKGGATAESVLSAAKASPEPATVVDIAEDDVAKAPRRIVRARTFSDPADPPETSAKRLALALWLNARPWNADVVCLTPGEHGVPQELLSLCGAGATDVTPAQLVRRLTDARECARLHHVLFDHASVINEVEGVLRALFIGVIGFVALALFNAASFSHVWTGLSAVLIAFCFVFGNSLRQLYENCVFIFYMKPFNVGDVLLIDGIKSVVHAIHLRHIIVVRDHGLHCAVPVHLLMNLHIVNESRSRILWTTIVFDADTVITLEQCDLVAQFVQEATLQHSDVLAGEYGVNLVPSESNADKIMLCVSFTHWPTSKHALLKDEARTFVVDAVCRGMQQAGIKVRAGGQRQTSAKNEPADSPHR